jgi:MFS family permease
MYTLEDDQETSARLRKRDFQSVLGANTADSVASPLSETLSPAASSPHKQITSSLQKLTTPEKASATPAGKRLALAALVVACVSVFVTSMDETVVVTALPKIIADPGINVPFTQLDHAAWIVSAYLLGFVIAMPLMGRISDIFGRRRIMLLCLSIFGIGSVFCALSPVLSQIVDLSFLSNFGIDTSSPGLILLISARFVQAIGGGAMIPVSMAIVSDFYGQKRLGLALGLIGAVTEAGGVVGPLYGALIVQTLGWTYIFYLNVPIVLVLLVGGWFFTPKHRHLGEKIDWLGALLLGLVLTCLSLGLAQQGTDLGPGSLNGSVPQNNPAALLLAVAFLALFILLGRLKSWRVPQISWRKRPHFVLVRQTRWPLIDLSLFTRFAFSAASFVSLGIGAALIIAMAGIPLFVDTVFSQQISANDISLVSGLALLRMTAMIPVGALLGGWLSGRLSCRIVGVLGLLFTACGFYLMSRWPLTVDWTQMTISTLTAGLGFGLVIAPISTTALNSARTTQAGMGSAIVTALRMIGMILGLSALTSWGLSYFKQLVSQYPSLPETATTAQFAQWTHGYAQHVIVSAHGLYSAVFFVTMLLCLIAIVPACFLWGRKPSLAESEQLAFVAAPVAETDPYSALTLAATAEPTDLLLAANPADGGKRRPRRRLIFALLAIALVLLLVGGLMAAFLWQSTAPSNQTAASSSSGNVVPTAAAFGSTGPRMINLALNNVALTSIFVSQLNLNSGTLSDIQATPLSGNNLMLTLNLNINSHGINRVLPVELDTTLHLDANHNLQLAVWRVKRDGLDAGSAAATAMQGALNQLLLSTVMPALRAQLQSAKLISVQTSATLACASGTEMLVLGVQAPPLQGQQNTTPQSKPAAPTTLCFTKSVNLSKLLPG